MKVPAQVTSTLEMPAVVPAAAPEFVRKFHRQDYRRRRRLAACQRHAGGRHLSQRHLAMGEAQHRPGRACVGPGGLHPVRQVRAGLPACRDPRQGL